MCQNLKNLKKKMKKKNKLAVGDEVVAFSMGRPVRQYKVLNIDLLDRAYFENGLITKDDINDDLSIDVISPDATLSGVLKYYYANEEIKKMLQQKSKHTFLLVKIDNIRSRLSVAAPSIEKMDEISKALDNVIDVLNYGCNTSTK